MNTSRKTRRISIFLQYGCCLVVLMMAGAAVFFGWKFHMTPDEALPLYTGSWQMLLERFVRLDGTIARRIINVDGLTNLIAFGSLMTVSWITREGMRRAEQHAEFI